jgi:hypothetical protein
MRATWLERMHYAGVARHKRLTDWHRVFAWWPVWIADGDCRWMEWVERRLTHEGGGYGNYLIYADYRALKASRSDTVGPEAAALSSSEHI